MMGIWISLMTWIAINDSQMGNSKAKLLIFDE